MVVAIGKTILTNAAVIGSYPAVLLKNPLSDINIGLKIKNITIASMKAKTNFETKYSTGSVL